LGRASPAQLLEAILVSYMTWIAGSVFLALVGARDVHRLPLVRHYHVLSENNSGGFHEFVNLSYDRIQFLNANIARPLHSVWNMMYTTKAIVNKTEKRLIVDTGSSVLWVRCAASASNNTPNITIRYGQGEVTGADAKASICLGDLCVNSQSLVLASAMSGIADTEHFDGLLGLGLPPLERDLAGPTFLQTLSTDFNNLAFGLDLNSEKDMSFITFGELKDIISEIKKMIPTGVTLPLSNDGMLGFWESSVKVSSPNVPGANTKSAVFDSGTSLIACSQSLFEQYAATLLDLDQCHQVGHTYVCNCTVDVKPLSFSFTSPVDGKHVDITLSRDDLLAWVSADRKVCMFTVVSSPSMPPGVDVTLGDVFLRKVYLIHDVKGKAVHMFAKLEEISTSVLIERFCLNFINLAVLLCVIVAIQRSFRARALLSAPNQRAMPLLQR